MLLPLLRSKLDREARNRQRIPLPLGLSPYSSPVRLDQHPSNDETTETKRQGLEQAASGIATKDLGWIRRREEEGDQHLRLATSDMAAVSRGLSGSTSPRLGSEEKGTLSVGWCGRDDARGGERAMERLALGRHRRCSRGGGDDAGRRGNGLGWRRCPWRVEVAAVERLVRQRRRATAEVAVTEVDRRSGLFAAAEEDRQLVRRRRQVAEAA